jgi:hypothetical protein
LDVLENRCLPTTVTTLADGAGGGSLRDAILTTPSGGVVSFRSGLTGTIVLTQGALFITKNLTITGPGADLITVSGNNVTQVFNVPAGPTVTISGLTIANGRAPAGAGLDNGASLTITDCIFTQNAAINSGTLSPTGAAIRNLGTLTLNDTTVSANTVAAGFFTGGGSIANQRVGLPTPTLTATNCTIANNSSTGIFNQGANLTLVNCTVAANRGGLDLATSVSVTVRNTIVAGNTPPGSNDVSGTVTSADHDLIGDGTGSTGVINGMNGNLVGTMLSPINPGLGLLLNNGGHTPTLALLVGSIAINAGTSAGAPATDQRGIPRPQTGVTDMGAYEFQAQTRAMAFFALGGSSGRVQIRRVIDGSLLYEFDPFGAFFNGGVTVAVGDVNGDGIPDLVTGAAAGNPNVKVFNGGAIVYGSFMPSNPAGSLVTSFFPYALNFNVGANVAVGDINRDGFGDIVTGADVGNPDVRVFNGRDIATGNFNPTGASLLAQWFPYGLNFNIGANVGVGDVNDDGFADVVTGATAGNPDVRVYNGKDIAQGTFNPVGASLLAQFFAYGLNFNVGALVAVGDVNGDGFGDVITGSSVGNPQVKVYDGRAIATGSFATFNPDASLLTSFFAFNVDANIGVSVGAADFTGTGRADILTGATTGTPSYRVVDGLSTGILPPAINGIDGVASDLVSGLFVGV